MLVSRSFNVRRSIITSFSYVGQLSNSKTYYDSQSGKYMQVPGSDGFKMHDVSLLSSVFGDQAVPLSTIHQHYDSVLSKQSTTSVSSVALDIFDTKNNYKSYDNDTAYETLSLLTRNTTSVGKNHCTLSNSSVVLRKFVDMRNLQDIVNIKCSGGEEIDCSPPFHIEVDCFSLLPRPPSTMGDDTDSATSVDVEGVATIRQFMGCHREHVQSNPYQMRVNLYLDITPLLSGGQSSGGGAGSGANVVRPVMDVMATVGTLCDLHAETVNIVLCSTVPYSAALADGSLSAAEEDLSDYLREVLEECIGLDVAGTAAQDRLSLQGAPLAVLRTAVGLGVKRFTVVDSAGVQALLASTASSSSLPVAPQSAGDAAAGGGDGHSGDVEVAVERGGTVYYCYTSDVCEVGPLLQSA